MNGRLIPSSHGRVAVAARERAVVVRVRELVQHGAAGAPQFAVAEVVRQPIDVDAAREVRVEALALEPGAAAARVETHVAYEA